MRRIVELHWPALLVGAACVGLALSIWASVPMAVAGAVALAAVVGALMLGDGARLVAVGVALAALGLAWGSLRMDALRESVLAADLGEAGVAELVTVAPARPSPWSTRVIAMTRAFRRAQVHERVLLILPVGRSPPRGAILEATVRIEEPRGPEDGFDERGWLARQGIHVVLKASSWRQVGRRGGIAGFGDRLRDRVERRRRARRDRRPPQHRSRRRARRGRRAVGRRAGRLPRLRSLPPARRLGAERRIPRRGRLPARLALPTLESASGARDARRDRRLRACRRLAAVGGPRRGRRSSRLAGVARLSPARPVALLRGRRARADGVDADVAPGARLPAVVRRRRRDLRRRSARPAQARRPAASAGARGGACRCPLLWPRDRADRPRPLRPGAGVHGAGERPRVPGRSARARVRAAGRGGRPGLSLGRRWALGARGLGGSVAGARRSGRRRFASRASGCPRRARTRDRLGRGVARRSTGTTASLVAAASGRRACSRPALLSSPPRGSRPQRRRRGTHRPASA